MGWFGESCLFLFLMSCLAGDCQGVFAGPLSTLGGGNGFKCCRVHHALLQWVNGRHQLLNIHERQHSPRGPLTHSARGWQFEGSRGFQDVVGHIASELLQQGCFQQNSAHFCLSHSGHSPHDSLPCALHRGMFPLIFLLCINWGEPQSEPHIVWFLSLSTGAAIRGH